MECTLDLLRTSKKLVTQLWKRSVCWRRGASYPIRTFPDYSSFYPLQPTVTLKGVRGDAVKHGFHCWAGPEFELRLVSAIIVLWFVTTTPIRNPLHKPRPLDATSNPHIPHPPSLLEKIYWRGNDICREERGGYIDWGKDGCVIIIG